LCLHFVLLQFERVIDPMGEAVWRHLFGKVFNRFGVSCGCFWCFLASILFFL
jgi:hypothetical protein